MVPKPLTGSSSAVIDLHGIEGGEDNKGEGEDESKGKGEGKG